MFDFHELQEAVHNRYIRPLLKLNKRLVTKYFEKTEAIDKIKQQPFYR